MLRVKELLSMTGASKGLTVDEAAAEIRSEPFYAISEALLNAAVAAIKEEGRMNQVADLPHGVLRHRWKDLLDEQIGEGWYAPIPGTNTHQWDRLVKNMQGSLNAEAIDAIDQASRKVVANLGDPHIKKLKRKGSPGTCSQERPQTTQPPSQRPQTLGFGSSLLSPVFTTTFEAKRKTDSTKT